MKILVTGNAGFIGYHVAKALMARGDSVVGFDNVNDYYEVALKESRLALLEEKAAIGGGDYTFVRGDLADRQAVERCFAEHGIQRVVHLAAQVGVRYSLENPHLYAESNLTGFMNVLDASRQAEVENFVYASSSSVYGANETLPFRETDNVDHPVSMYAATKKANELMAHSYSHLYRMPTTGLRFFTVYGPWGRPDMALFKFTRNILEGKPIPVFNHGEHSRDFTYIDDIVEGVIRANDNPAAPDPEWDGAVPSSATSSAPYRLFNIGNSQPVKLSRYIQAIERALGKKAEMELLPMQPGDVPDTFADCQALEAAVGYKPSTDLNSGVERFVSWYRNYYGV